MSTWRAIHFIEGETIKEFLDQFKSYGEDLNRTVEWSVMGGIFRMALDNPSPDGRVHCYLPIKVRN